mmetsp:Transcript_23006/g.54506  ORF Transcript_23006/g.54506 Transcript_23006/m.54506 type:complete len:539 (-) Transcript_23006:1011-2627(-)
MSRSSGELRSSATTARSGGAAEAAGPAGAAKAAGPGTGCESFEAGLGLRSGGLSRFAFSCGLPVKSFPVYVSRGGGARARDISLTCLPTKRPDDLDRSRPCSRCSAGRGAPPRFGRTLFGCNGGGIRYTLAGIALLALHQQLGASPALAQPTLGTCTGTRARSAPSAGMTTAPAEKEAGAPPLLPAKEAGAPPLPTAQQPGGRRRARLILGLVLAVALAAAAAQLWVGGRTLTRLVLARGVSRPAALTSNTNAARQAAWGALGSSCDAVAARPAASRCNHEQFADVCERRAKGLRTFCEGHSSGACIAAPRGDGVLCDLRHVHIARLGATRNWVGEGASVRRQTSYQLLPAPGAVRLQCDSKFWPPAGMFLPKNRAQVSSWGFDHWLIKGAVVNASKPLARASGGEVDGACVPGVSVFVQRYTGLNFWHTMESVFALIESLFLLGIRPSEARAVFFDGWALTRPASRGLEAVWASVLTAAPPMHFWGESRDLPGGEGLLATGGGCFERLAVPYSQRASHTALRRMYTLFYFFKTTSCL